MNQENKIPNQLKGPPAYEHWRACLSGHSTQTADEYPLYTDAHVTSDEPCIAYGPYHFLNNVFLSSPKQELRPAIILRVEIHLDYNPNLPPNLGKTDSELLHGGSLSDEIAALGSSSFGYSAEGRWSV
jgi:hypothetical protein